MGKKWHLMRKGFEPDTEVLWKKNVLEKMCGVLSELAPGGEFQWKNKEEVHFLLPDQKLPWVTMQTKKPDALWALVAGPEGSLKLDHVRGLADSANIEVDAYDRDVMRMAFTSKEQVQSEAMEKFLNGHLQTMMAGSR